VPQLQRAFGCALEQLGLGKSSVDQQTLVPPRFSRSGGDALYQRCRVDSPILGIPRRTNCWLLSRSPGEGRCVGGQIQRRAWHWEFRIACAEATMAAVAHKPIAPNSSADGQTVPGWTPKVSIRPQSKGDDVNADSPSMARAMTAILADLIAEPVESGVSHSAEPLISEFIRLYGDWMLCDLVFKTQPINHSRSADVLHLLGRQKAALSRWPRCRSI
jgi:hypothetical protein